MNYCPVKDGQTDGQTESNAYEPNVQYAQVGSKKAVLCTGIIIVQCDRQTNSDA